MKDLHTTAQADPFSAPISRHIWDMKYRFQDPVTRDPDAQGKDRGVHDVTVEDTWHRIAKNLASVEGENIRSEMEDKFYAALENFRYLPAGRITAGAGTARSVTLFNCFVNGTIPDSMDGIFDMLKDAALTMQQGGGIGYDFSTIRPKGAPVIGVGSDASGPLSFMDVWDAMCRTIMSAGSRRGAMMATMRCDHPDIEDFITAKRDAARLRNFNVSVLVTDPFMEAVKNDGDWDLVWKGKVWKTLRARALWDLIMESTYNYAEPGVIFIDRINERNNLKYCETIAATNPCVTADTWVLTAEGPRQVSDLIGRPFSALVDGKAWVSGAAGFFKTGTKPVLKLTTTCGRELRLTADHLVRNVLEKTRFRIEKGWIEAGKLSSGDEIVIHDQRGAAWAGTETAERGYLLGLLVGNGVIKSDKTLLSVWTANPTADGTVVADPVMARTEEILRGMPHRSDFAGWMHVSDRNEFRMGTAALTDLAKRFGMSQGNKSITPEIEREGSDFSASFLRGLFDADGTVIGSQEKGVSVRLSQSDLPLLQAAQRMLGRLGITSTIYQDRREAGVRLLPDGHGGHMECETKAQHELVISGENIQIFAERVGFEHTEKSTRLANALSGYRRAMNRERFTVTVASVEPCGVEDVYDVQVPGVNAFDANGFYIHNCGEQPLPPYGACLLGSINLARLIAHPFEDDAHLDLENLERLVATAVRMMDNVVDVSNFPLPQQQAEAKAKRRIGLGVTGLADALLMLRLTYGTEEAALKTEEWMKAIQHAAYRASVELAKEKGTFPLFDAKKYLASPTIQDLDEDLKDAISEHGIRNALLTSIAPTGTISLYAGNVSSGIEPVFAYAYTRKVLQPDGSRTEEEVVDYAVQLYRDKFGLTATDPLPDYFVSAQTLSPMAHVRMQSAAQKWIDSSISKTINCPEDISFEDFKDVYMAAFDQGCKGCTTYRPNAVTGSVLTVSDGKKDEKKTEENLAEKIPAPASSVAPLPRDPVLDGKTYKLKWPEAAHAFYITINDAILEDGSRRPFEIFISTKNVDSKAWIDALTLMISAVFRRGGDVSFIVEELEGVYDARGGAFMPGKGYVKSLIAAIGDVIRQHMAGLGLIAAPFVKGEVISSETGESCDDVPLIAPKKQQRDGCPNYGECDMVFESGCWSCKTCGFSKCG